MNKTLDKQSLKEHVLSNGCIDIDKGENTFIVTQINDENFNDISPKLKQQLENEGKYNSWIGFITNTQLPYSIQSLPIYGNPRVYVTKYFTNSAEESIEQCLRDRQMDLLKGQTTIEGRKTMKKFYLKFIEMRTLYQTQ